jgi:hypothetical protein
MIKACLWCHKEFDGDPRSKYCPGGKCKKNYENSLRSGPKEHHKPGKPPKYKPPSPPINRPLGLNPLAAAYWDKIAPTVIRRGHLNVLSEDAFAELCDLHSRLSDINKMINNGVTEQCPGCGDEIHFHSNRSLLQIDDKWDNKAGTETASFKESALSDLKRKYSRQFLDYCKQFYLTPLSNRGNFNIEEEPKHKKENDGIFD